MEYPARDPWRSSTSHVVRSSWMARVKSTDLPTDIFDPTDVIHRRIHDERTTADDPLCLVLDCGDWSDNIVTTWIVDLVSTRPAKHSCPTPLGQEAP